MHAIAELYAPPEVLQALRDGRQSGLWIRAKCPFCDPEGRKRRNLAASHTGFGRNRDKPGWVCHACHAEEDLRRARKNRGEIRYDPDAAKNDEKRRLAAAQKIIEQSRSIEDGDPVDRYLRGRKLAPAGAFWPHSLRKAFLKHPNGDERYPTLLGVVTDVANMAVGVHRTYLTQSGVKAPLTPSKLSLGPISGGAIRLGIDSSTIVVAEGIESAIAAAMFIQRGVPWSALSAGNMARLSIPRSVTTVLIAPDRDDNNVGRKAAVTLRERIKDLQSSQDRKIEVEIIPPPRGRSDFADFG